LHGSDDEAGGPDAPAFEHADVDALRARAGRDKGERSGKRNTDGG